MKHFKQLGRDTLYYGLSAALQKFITFLLFPLYTRLLTTSDFGAQDLVSTAITIVTLFLILGLDSGVILHYYGAKPEDKAKILSTWLWFEVLMPIPVCAVLIAFASPICDSIFNNAGLSFYFVLGVLSIPFSQVSKVILMTLRVTFETRKFVIVTTAGVLFQVLAAILFVVLMHWGIAGIFLAILVSSILQMLLGLAFTAHQFRFSFSASWLKSLIKVGVPLVPASLSVWVLNYANRYFLVRYVGLSDIGLMSVALRISSILLFVISAFEIAWGPFAYSVANDPQAARRIYSKVLTYFLLLSLSGATGLSVFAREVTRVLATSVYEASASLVSLYCYSSIFWICLYIVGMGAGIAKRTYHNSIAIGLGALGNTILNYLLIPNWGIAGAAIATMLGNLIAMVYMYFAGQHYFFVHYEFTKLLPLFSAASLTIFVGVLVDSHSPVWNAQLLLLKGLLAMVFIGSLFALRIITVENISVVWSFLQARLAQASARESIS